LGFRDTVKHARPIVAAERPLSTAALANGTYLPMSETSDQPGSESVQASVLGPVLRVLNELVAGRFLLEYAHGGGVGVLYYL
jgi:hypothetical protein